MWKTLKTRALATMLALVMVIASLPMSTFAAYNEVKTGYDESAKVLSLHANTGTENIATLDADAVKDYFEYGEADTWKIVDNQNKSVLSCTLGVCLDTCNVTQGSEYSVQKLTRFKWVTTATFTVKVYDTLTIKNNLLTDEQTVNIYRGDTYDIEVKQKDNCTVTVSGAVKGEEAGTYTVANLTGDATVNITYAADTQSTISVGSNVGGATVDYLEPVDAGTKATVTVTPKENYYVSTVALSTSVGVQTWDSKEYVSGGTGAYKATFTAAEEKTAYIVDVASAPILSWKSDSLTIGYNDKTSKEEAEAAILELLNVADGIDKSNVKIEYKAKDKFITEEVWQAIDQSAPLGGHAFGQKEETIRVSYVYNDTLPQYQSTTIEVTISLDDPRQESEIHVKESVQIGYAGTPITKEQVLNEVFTSVTDKDGKNILEEVTDEVSISETEILSVSIWAYKKGADEYNTPITGNIGSNTDLSALIADVTGDYKVTVQYAGNKNYLPATTEAYFSIYDNRLETTIQTQDVSVDATDIGNISYADVAIKQLLLTSVTDEEGGTLNTDDVKITSVWCTSEDSLPVLKQRPLTKVGVYKVYFEYSDTTTHKKSTAEATLTINDARPTAVINLKADQEIAYTKANPLTEEAIYSLVMDSIEVGETSLDSGYTSRPKSVSIALKDGDDASIDASAITEAGTYKIVITVSDTDTYKGSESSVTFTVTDGRNVTKVLIKDDAQVAYDFADGLSQKEILDALEVSVVDTTNDSAINDYKVTFYQNEKEIKPEDMKVDQTYTIKVIFEGNDVQAPSSKTATFEVVDAREEATLILKEEASVVYKGEKFTNDEILEAVFDSLLNASDGEISTDNLTATANKDVLNVGTYDVTVKFAGDVTYKPTSATTTLTVDKADAAVNVTSKTVNYKDVKKDGANISDLITTEPENAGCIEFAVGISLGEEAKDNTAAVAYVNLPQLIDVDSISNAYVKKAVQAVLDKIGEGSSMSISELNKTLKSMLESLEKIEGALELADIELDTEAIEALINALEAIENLNGISELKVQLTMGKDIVVKDSGMYLIGGVVADSNYNTAVNVGYLLITPNATKVKLAFNMEDANGIITREAILSGNYDLGSHVVEDELSEEDLEDATAHLINLYLGVDINGDTYISETPSTEIGAYTQIAFISDLGNEMYYAVPIVRAYAVVADTAIVTFIDENGDENNDRIFTYDGNPHSMTAVATTRDGERLPDENISYMYIGIEGDGEGYNSSTAPTNAGAYTVIATYLDADHTYVGMAIGAMVISPAEASVTVNDVTHIYDGTAVDVTAMIEKTPEDAKMAVVMAGIDVNGDFSENGWSAVDGVVNIDFPSRVDTILKEIVPAAYEDGIKVSDFTAKLSKIKGKLATAGIESEYADRIVEILDQMSDKVTLTFKEQSEVNPSNIGAYLVGAVIMDPDYEAVSDTGILIIAPKITKAELKWNYVDENGVITSPILGLVDFDASAYVSDAKDDAITGKIQYLFFGVDADGNEVRTNDASTLTNGVYTQIAYVEAEDISASMTIAAPIMRTIVIVPQTVTVEFVDETGTVNNDRQFTYDGNPKAMDVRVSQNNTTITGERLENLTVRYVGADSVNATYNSTTAPTNVGAYTVIATYVEKDANGQILYAGATVGAMVIKPQDVTFEVKDTTVPHDGKEKFVEIVNDADMKYVAVVVDEDKNVNILFPASWNVQQSSVNIAGGINKIVSIIENLPSSAQNTELVQKLSEILSKIDMKSLTLKGAKPKELGTYNITALAYKANTNVIVDSGVLTITHDWSDHTYYYDEDDHWHECACEGCDVKKDEGTHTGGTATCTQQAICEVCGQKYGEAKGHSYGDWYTVDSPKCVDKGSERRDCSACDHFETRDLDETGHTWETEFTVDKEATCTEDGSKSIHCSACTAKKDSTVIPGGHTEELVPGKEATCTEDGLTEGKKCSVCGETLVAQEVIPATGHDMTEWKVVTEATATKDGLKERHCTKCGHKESEVLPATGTTPGDDGTGTTPDKGDDNTSETPEKDTQDAVKPEVGAAPTGDSNHFVLWISMIISMVAILAQVKSNRRKARKH